MKQYVFGYLFVRFARLLAVLVVVIAVIFTVSRLWQASTHAEACRYAPSFVLGQRLLMLNESYRSTVDILSHLLARETNSDPAAPQFPKAVQSAQDFEEVNKGLAALAAGRSQIKHAVIERFETSIQQIESLLRAHAASIRGEEASTQPAAPSATPSNRVVIFESLFSRQVDATEARSRIGELEEAKEFLRVVGGSAENPKNQQILNASINELDALKVLLSSVPQPVSHQAIVPPVTGVSKPVEIDAEKIAYRLSQLVTSVRTAVLSSWRLDDALEGVTDLAETEALKSRVANLAVRTAWVNAAQQLLLVVFGLLFFAFMVCVIADVIQALMDTANNSRATAENTSR